MRNWVTSPVPSPALSPGSEWPQGDQEEEEGVGARREGGRLLTGCAGFRRGGEFLGVGGGCWVLRALQFWSGGSWEAAAMRGGSAAHPLRRDGLHHPTGMVPTIASAAGRAGTEI